MTERSFPHISLEAKFADDAIFIGDVYIRENCIIESKVKIDGSEARVVVESGSRIDEGTFIKSKNERITIGQDSKIGKNCRIFRSIAKNSVIEDNSEVN